ncbi:hypothetical protein [Silvanigrella sp.]|jgi:hypothetical protein|uniref:hypothetical protein n=1 Tax=Silvanigrella sp. TaxID=2024976 RepID=UPI0037CA19C5
MPIIAPDVVYFNKTNQIEHNYTNISADYNTKKLNCKLNNSNSKVKVFQKKWILYTADKKREIETYSDSIDFSLAQKFPTLTCETILFDGLLYKKDLIKESFSVFENWPNISPGVNSYTISSISDFSISNYFKTKEVDQFFFCESGSDNVEENNFCSLIDKETGGIESKNSDYQKISNLLGNEKYRIFNLTVGLKKESNVVSKIGIQFVLNNIDIEKEKIKIPPYIEFKNSIFDKSFICHSNSFLYNPNNKDFIWYKNDKIIPDFNLQVLPEKYIKYGENYQCSNNNGISKVFEIDNKYLEIVGPNQIGFEKNIKPKIIQYSTNLNIMSLKHEWVCKESNNIQCNILDSGEPNTIQIKIIPNDSFKKSLLHEKIKISLNINNEIFEKEIVIFNVFENQENFDNISDKLSISADRNEQIFECNIPESIQKSSFYNIYWFAGNSEIKDFRNKSTLNYNLNKNYITCIVAGKILNNSIIGASSYIVRDPNKKNPSWLRDSYVFNLNNISKKFLFKDNLDFHSNHIKCYLSNKENYKLTENICYADKNNNVFLKFNDTDINNIKNYIKDSQLIDLFNIPKFPLVIRVFENNKYTNLYSNVKFFISNFKPNILFSGILDLEQGQKCFVITQDPQKLFLSTQFILEKNKLNKNIINFERKNSIKNMNIIRLLEKKQIYYYEYNFNFNQKEDFCNIVVTNGTTLSHGKTIKINEKNLENTLKSINNKYKKIEINNISLNNYNVNIKKNYLDNLDKVNIFLHKNNNINSFSPFQLKFHFINEETNLDLFYSESGYLENLTKYPIIEKIKKKEAENKLNEEKLDIFNGYFLGSKLSKKDNNEYICEASFIHIGKPQLLKYHIFLNDQYILSKNSYKNNINFELKNTNNLDTVTCQIEIENKIETSSLTEKDDTGILSYCYAMDKNNCILSFDCPDIINLKYKDKELTDLIEEKLINNFKNTSNIKYAYITIWTESQKNKISLIKKINEIN